ncbi:MAG: hypothetical protein A2015_08150 [Spirochaetes bacterium GWF1_31_7]|nr:MAG: hypothetical protein A2Y30_02240 [Spirochaetes bacterium GWE1_32_154]OHD47012.1 MAG: hypothetical protein A2015_08150 [Spirochaetes bacterium GWF1_31_7]OHD79069.1 MAG: hypothetical protein A2355_00690 [Spirochaetes bacterium RIFOXYB1_FULL_32_8]HBD96265.1 hypothetical protein [Spirochaetia bacterium]HBI37010.1 hypothetical protein [Spirochaetia bacterium]
MPYEDKILIVNNSDLLNNFLTDCFKKYNIELIIVKNPFDAIIKLKNELPDLVIIEYQLVMDEKIDFFKEKKEYKPISEIPIICLSSKVDMNSILKAGKNKVYKFFEKPIKQDFLLKAVSELLKRDLKFDDTPSIMEVSLNNDMLFIEIGMGINYEKLNSLKYKIIELMKLYKFNKIKSLIMFNDVTFNEDRLFCLIKTILETTKASPTMIKILSTNASVKLNLEKNEKYSKIDVFNDLSLAMDSIGTINIESLVSNSNIENSGEFSLADSELTSKYFNKATVALVDDDEFVIDLVEASLQPLELNIIKFTNGNLFLDEVAKGNIPDLVFLDLMMPSITGFEILEKMKEKKYTIPVIIFSSLSQKETVTRVLKYGVRSYIVKPIDPELIIKKASEILKSDF